MQELRETAPEQDLPDSGMVRAGAFGNVLVRRHLAEAAWQGSKRHKHGLPGTVSNKVLREEENRRFVGGMRSPARAVQRVPGLRAAGAEVRRVFAPFLADHAGVRDMVVKFGSKDFDGPPADVLDGWKKVFQRVLGARDVSTPLDFVEGALAANTAEPTDIGGEVGHVDGNGRDGAVADTAVAIQPI